MLLIMTYYIIDLTNRRTDAFEVFEFNQLFPKQNELHFLNVQIRCVFSNRNTEVDIIFLYRTLHAFSATTYVLFSTVNEN